MTPLPLPRAARRALPIAALLLTIATAAQAQGTDAQREACTPDALKLCSDTIPDIPKTTACMKVHEAALSPRCRAVFDAPAMKQPTVAAASEAVETRREKHARRETAERAASQVHPRHRVETSNETYADPLGATRAIAGDDEMPVARAPLDEDAGPAIRHFPPGDGPDPADVPPPYDDGRYDGGPRYLGPGAWDRQRFADRDDPDAYDGPGPRDDADDRGRGAGPWRRHAAPPARKVIARLCATGEIDPHTCAVTERALRRDRRE